MNGKKIYRYTNVELLNLIKNGTEEIQVLEAKAELKSRNLNSEKLNELESEYLKFKKLQEERKNQSLTHEEWLSFFLLPFFTPKSKWREDHFSESEMERFNKYGFEKKAREAQKVKTLGVLFWFVIITSGIVIYQYINM